MSREPLVTVLMAVHNDAAFLPTAVQSILGQTFRDFEFLIIDDASTDGSADYLRSLDDPRVRVVTNPTNLGLTRSLNIGLGIARGQCIARMDGDDMSEPNRLDLQVAFLNANPHVGLLGTSRTLIDANGHTIAGAPAATGRAAVLWKMLLGNAFAHPSVMIRRDVIERHGLRYDESFQTAQDYELWVRMLAHTHGDNLADRLLRYRIRESGISRTRKVDQLANHDRIAYAAIRTILPEFEISRNDVRELRGRFGGFSVRESEMNPDDAEWRDRLNEMSQAFERRYGVPPLPVPSVRG